MKKDSTTDNPSELKPQVENKKECLRQNTNDHKAKQISISLDIFERINLRCLTWEDAKPHVDLLEKVYGNPLRGERTDDPLCVDLIGYR